MYHISLLFFFCPPALLCYLEQTLEMTRNGGIPEEAKQVKGEAAKRWRDTKWREWWTEKETDIETDGMTRGWIDKQDRDGRAPPS